MFLLAPKSEAKTDFAQEPENTAAQNRDADDAGRACAHPVGRVARHVATMEQASDCESAIYRQVSGTVASRRSWPTLGARKR